MKTTRRIARVLACCLLLPLAVLLAITAPLGIALGAATLTSCKVTCTLNWQYELAVTGITNTTQNYNQLTTTVSMTNGTGAAGTANLIYVVQATISASGNTTINVNSTPVTDFFGANIVMARVKFFFVLHLTTTTASSISIGNATNPIVNWISVGTSTIKVNNGGVWVQGDSGATAYAVTASTADVLKVLNNDGANSATVAIGIVGSTA